MPYQNDLATLADVVSPVYAANQAGIQNEAANQKQQMENQVYQAQMPALEQEPGLKNLFTQAQTAQTSNLAQGDMLKNIETAGSLGSTINAANAGNNLKITQDQAAKLNTLGQMAGQIAGMMDNVPAPARPAMMQRILIQAGVRPDQLESLGPILSGDPDLLRHVATNITQMSPGFQQATAVEGQRAQAQRDVANITSDARVTAAEKSAQARIQAAEINRQAKQQALNFEQLAAQRYAAGDMKGAEQLRQAAASVRQLAAQTTQSLVGVQPQFGGFDQGAPAPTATPPAATTGGQAPAPGDVEAEMKRRGLLK
jgi:hypothetical protein